MVTLEEFVAAPSERLLVELTKEQLWKVADNYRIELPSVLKSAKKKNLVGFIREFLKEKQILPVLTPINPGSETQADIVANMLGPTMESESSDLTFEQQRELLKLQMDMALEKRKLELELKQLEAQEKEKDRWLEMEKLKHQEQEREVERTRLRLLAEGKVDRNKSSGKSDLAGMIKFLPKFNERDPDIFFSLFENIAAGRNWDDEDKTILLQTVLVGRAQEAFVALTPADRKVYDIVKQAVLKCYELIPEAYRQRFRDWRKGEEQTHTEVARELSSFFNRWLAAEGVETFDALRDLLILEQFKNILPERITVYVNEHEVKTVAEAAVLADGFVLTHKGKVREYLSRYENDRNQYRSGRVNAAPFVKFHPPTKNKARDTSVGERCNYCLEVGHWKKECPVLRTRNKAETDHGNAVACVFSVSHPEKPAMIDMEGLNVVQPDERKDLEAGSSDKRVTSGVSDVSDYAPFISDGFVSLVGDAHRVPVKILRDTGASESFICASVLPLSPLSDTGKCVLIRGIGLQPFPVPLHRIQLFSGFVNGEVTIAVRPSLPVDGIHIILGNNLGGCLVSPPPVVTVAPLPLAEPDKCLQDFPEVFTACAVTRAMARAQVESPSDVSKMSVAGLFVPELPASLSYDELVEAQGKDQSLEKFFALAAADPGKGYLVQNGVLLRKWLFCADPDVADQVMQVVVPDKYRDLVLKTAHGVESGHFGVKKTYNYILRHFYWPRVKRDVMRFVRTCHVCQVAGKPNATIKPAPLQPIPSVGTPFEHIIIDCVGPLTPSKTGCIYLFTVMCQATRYPAAYALRAITTKSIMKCLSQFISVFGIPKIIQSDRGSNFTSKTFAAALRLLRVKHHLSSAYHAQSQGALERFHATLKSLLRAYCVEMKRDWEEALPWLLLAARGVIQESTGFCPNDLVFGHKVRTSLSVLNAEFDQSKTPASLVEYVDGFRRKLFLSWKLACEHLSAAQGNMKRRYDRKAEARVFNPGDQVVALLPIPGSALTAKYSGPFTIMRQVSETNYVLSTPERKRSTQLCHINLLKPYYSASSGVASGHAGNPVGLVVVEGPPNIAQVAAEDGVQVPDEAVLQGRLKNTQKLADLDSLLAHLIAVTPQTTGRYSSVAQSMRAPPLYVVEETEAENHFSNLCAEGPPAEHALHPDALGRGPLHSGSELGGGAGREGEEKEVKTSTAVNHLPSRAAKRVTAASRFSVGTADVFRSGRGPQSSTEGPLAIMEADRIGALRWPRSVKSAPLRFPGIRRAKFNLAELYYYGDGDGENAASIAASPGLSQTDETLGWVGLHTCGAEQSWHPG
ncbi:Retrovirus-related Pol polyprotein from transposon 412 [Merluccius polli]|uniref:Gypsy retrotransposon integrase-like protein 1 n=1 Tax=Merluccius polli TaxID=89951 RepID=A0AA47N6T7_MERPO|nr:Retrovirus-related Pol polyprotein from transposon 412 [Merluccius polli]